MPKRIETRTKSPSKARAKRASKEGRYVSAMVARRVAFPSTVVVAERLPPPESYDEATAQIRAVVQRRRKALHALAKL